MFKTFPEFVPQKVCLSCDGCCRFKDEDSLWRPKLAKEEKGVVKAKIDLADKIFLNDVIDMRGHLKAAPCYGSFQCAFFKMEDNTCRIYQDRPFECQLYPYLLSRKEGRAAVFVHLNCPHVQEKFGKVEFKDYVGRLKKFLLEADVQLFLKKNPQLIADYSGYQDELEYLFDVNV